jgi:hypothetical protein
MITRAPKPYRRESIETLEKGTLLHRIHDQRFTGSGFNPGIGQLRGTSRFAPLVNSDDSRVPTMYGAESFECAIMETIFHNIMPGVEGQNIRIQDIENLTYTILSTKRPLSIAALHTVDLKAIGLSRAQLIDCTASYYEATADWALDVHDSNSDIEGMVWTSRQFDSYKAYVLFGTRATADDFHEVESHDITSSDTFLGVVRNVGKRANCEILLRS